MKKKMSIMSALLGMLVFAPVAVAHDAHPLSVNVNVFAVSDNNLFKDVAPTLSSVPGVQKIQGHRERVVAAWRVPKNIDIQSIANALDAFEIEAVASYNGRAGHGRLIPLEIGAERDYLKSVSFRQMRGGRIKRTEERGTAFTGIKVNIVPKSTKGAIHMNVEQRLSALSVLYSTKHMSEPIQGRRVRISEVDVRIPKNSDAIAYLARGLGKNDYVLTVVSAEK